MPELPEVETIRRDLEKDVVGRRIKEVEVLGERSIRRHASPEEFRSRLEGRKIDRVQRRGKYLVLELDGEELLVVHLRMSGQLLRAKSPKEPLAKHTHVVITFSQGGQLRFVDPRTFGELFLVSARSVEQEAPELVEMGFDPVEEIMSWQHFGALLRARHQPLKAALTDQRFVAGIGNVYADEILFAAGLRFDRPSDSLSPQELRRLYRSMVETLQEAIKHRGSSLADEQYRDLFGETGSYQGEHCVYDREGQACPRCRARIVRVKFAGRSTYFCEQCQV